MTHELNNTIRAIAQCEQAARELGKSLDKFAESGEKFRESADRAARLEKKISDSNAFGRLLESTAEIRRMSEYFAKNLPDFTAAMVSAKEAAAGSQKELQEGMEAAKSVIPGLQAMGQVGRDVASIRESLEHLKTADLAGEAAQLVQVQKDLEDRVFSQKGMLQQAKDLVTGQTASMELAAKELQESLDLCNRQAVQAESLIAANVDALRRELSALWKEGQDAWGKALDSRQKAAAEAQLQLLQETTGRLEVYQAEALDKLAGLLTGSLQRTETLLEDGLKTMEEDLHAHMELQEEHLAALERQNNSIAEERLELARTVREGADYLSRTAEASAAAVADTAELMAKRLEAVLQTSLDRLIRSQEEQMADIRRRLDRLERMVQEAGKVTDLEEQILEMTAELEDAGAANKTDLLVALQKAAEALPAQVSAALAEQGLSAAKGKEPAAAAKTEAPAKPLAAEAAAKKEPAAPVKAAPKALTYTELLELTPPFTVRKDNWKGDFCYRVEKISGSHIRGKYYKDGKLYPKLDAPDVLGTFYLID